MNPMEEIWNSVSKSGKDGKRSITLKGVGDLAFLYLSGFVDVKQHNFKSWIAAFQPSKLADGSFAVTHDQWLEKRKFRYEGPVETPFDPNTIEEKEYTEDEFIKLMGKEILPNTQFDPGVIPQMMANLRLQKKSQNGKVNLDKKLKHELIELLNRYPHPQRVLQAMVYALKEGKGKQVALSQAEAQKSSFTAGLSIQQMAQTRLAEISKELKKEGVALPESQVPAISLKDLKKKRPPTGGRV